MLGLTLKITGGTVLNSTPAASLDLDFTAGETLDSRVSFSRASQAYLYDSTGLFQPAPHNILLSSQDASAAVWTKSAASVSGSVALSPFGDVTADELIESTATATGHTLQQVISYTSGLSYTLSIYVKRASGTRNVRLIFGGTAFGANMTANFDLGTGTVGTLASGVTATITAAANGFYRISATAVATATASTNFQVAMMSGVAASYDGDGASSLYVYGAMAEPYAGLRQYVNTSQRNMFGFSEAIDNAAWGKSNVTVTANALTGPTGLTDAEKIV
jgi:hypothetical protein